MWRSDQNSELQSDYKLRWTDEGTHITKLTQLEELGRLEMSMVGLWPVFRNFTDYVAQLIFKVKNKPHSSIIKLKIPSCQISLKIFTYSGL